MSEDSTDSDLEIKIIEDEDKKDVIDLARRFFNKDEPLNEYISLTGPDGRCPDLEAYILSTLEEGTSVKAVSDGKLVAFSMNGVVSRDDPNEKTCVDSPKFQLILDFLLYNTVECDVFNRYPEVDKAMTVKILSVDPCVRGRGVATKLVAKTRPLQSICTVDQFINENMDYENTCDFTNNAAFQLIAFNVLIAFIIWRNTEWKGKSSGGTGQEGGDQEGGTGGGSWWGGKKKEEPSREEAQASGEEAQASGGEAKVSGGETQASGGEVQATGGEEQATGGEAQATGGAAQASEGGGQVSEEAAKDAGGSEPEPEEGDPVLDEVQRIQEIREVEPPAEDQ